MKTILAVIFVALFCATFTATGTAHAQADPKRSLLDALAQESLLPEGIQSVTFGPMKNGRTIVMRVEYRNSGEAISIERMPSADGFLVVIPRSRLIKIPLKVDAMLGCSRDRRWCAEMHRYLDRLERVQNIARLPFFDDLYPESAPVFEGLRGSPVWGASVLDGIRTAIVAIIGHELGHAALGHLEESAVTPADILRQEGEADGFLIALLQMSDFSGVGDLALMVVNILDHEKRGGRVSTHPAPICRTIAFAEETLNWFARHGETARGEAETRGVPLELPPAEGLSAAWSDLVAQNDLDCDAYLADVARGFEQARLLVDENTPLNSVP